MSKIYFKKLHENAVIPSRGSALAAGLDLSSIEHTVIEPGERAIIPTGLMTKIPTNTYLRISPRSGLAAKHGIDTMAGVVDADYRGELRVILINLGKTPFEVKVGDRIAQAILERCELAEVDEVDQLDDTERGSSGFGSTGV
jgi:dUTP pyrophosphatase